MREDWIYLDDEVHHISLIRHEGYMTFSEKFRKHFGDYYAVDAKGCLYTTKLGTTINLKTQIAMLKSSDASLYEEHKHLWDGEFRFLDGEDPHTRIAFCSYPRSGNSLMR